MRYPTAALRIPKTRTPLNWRQCWKSTSNSINQGNSESTLVFLLLEFRTIFMPSRAVREAVMRCMVAEAKMRKRFGPFGAIQPRDGSRVFLSSGSSAIGPRAPSPNSLRSQSTGFNEHQHLSRGESGRLRSMETGRSSNPATIYDTVNNRSTDLRSLSPSKGLETEPISIREI